MDRSEAYPAPAIDETNCPNLQAALAMETGANTVYNLANVSPNAISNSGFNDTWIFTKSGVVVSTATRIAIQALCEACPGLDPAGNCPRQLQADRIFEAMPASYSGGTPTTAVRPTVTRPERELPKTITLHID